MRRTAVGVASGAASRSSAARGRTNLSGRASLSFGAFPIDSCSPLPPHQNGGACSTHVPQPCLRSSTRPLATRPLLCRSSFARCALPAPPLMAQLARQCAVSSTSTLSGSRPGSRPKRRHSWTTKELDAWAEGPTVLGHTYSQGMDEAYAPSTFQDLGSGIDPPPGWVVRMFSAAGFKGYKSPNQDACSYSLLSNGWMVAVACDGHGDDGEIVAERVARSLPFLLSERLDSLGPSDALEEAFREAQLDLEAGFPSEQHHGGSAVCVWVAHIERREAWLAWVGDSRAVVADLGEHAPTDVMPDSDPAWSIGFATLEHKAHDPIEKERVKKAGGQIVIREYEDGDVVSRIYVPRTGMPGIAMSRSLGDGSVKRFGVTAEPEIFDATEIWRRCKAPMVLLASDGLWDFVSDEEVVESFVEGRSAGDEVAQGVRSLVRMAQKRWVEVEADYCDDVTAMVIFGPSSP